MTDNEPVDAEWQRNFDKWLLQQPEAIRTLAREFPPGTCFKVRMK